MTSIGTMPPMLDLPPPLPVLSLPSTTLFTPGCSSCNDLGISDVPRELYMSVCRSSSLPDSSLCSCVVVVVPVHRSAV